METVDEIDAVADELSPAMRHVLSRCSDEGWWHYEDTGCWREWRDVVAGRSHATFRGTVRALERRGLVALKDVPGMCCMVALTRKGLRVQAACRLRGMKALTA